MRFFDEVTTSERAQIKTALKAVKNFGDNLHRRIADFILQTDIYVFVGPVSQVRGSGSVHLSDHVEASKAVSKGDLSFIEAASFVRLNIARETIETGGQRGIEGTLVHEGKHALDFAKMLTTFSAGVEAKIFNPTAFQKECSAHLTAAFYLTRRGGEFSAEGISLGLLEEKDGVIIVSPEGIRQRLKNCYGLSPEAPGATLDTAANPPISVPQNKLRERL